MTSNITYLIIAIVLFVVSGIGLGISIERNIYPPQFYPVIVEKIEYRDRVFLKSLPEVIEYEEFELPDGNHKFKSWLDEAAITNTHSRQYAYTVLAGTEECGLLVFNNCYCVAMGSFYGDLGTEYRVTLDTGVQFNIIITERKADEHTDALHQYTKSDNSILEFIVDKDRLPKEIQLYGDISKIDFFKGNIVKLEQRITPRK